MTLLLILVGMLALMFIAWLASENRRAIRWRTVLGRSPCKPVLLRWCSISPPDKSCSVP